VKCRHPNCPHEASQLRYPSGKLRKRGLCWRCHANPAIRALYPLEPKRPPRDTEPTEEELERTIREQKRRLPKWWARHVEDQERRETG